MTEDFYTDEEYVEDFLQDSSKPFKDPSLLSQRIPKKEFMKRIAHACRYPVHEVEDVFEGMMKVINEEFERGREVFFDPLFSVRLYKPFTRRIYDNKLGGFKTSSARPRLWLRTSDEYLRYSRYGMHSPVNYLPPSKSGDPLLNRYGFTEALRKATELWKEEESKREAKRKKLEE
jgi:hypothetical protein